MRIRHALLLFVLAIALGAIVAACSAPAARSVEPQADGTIVERTFGVPTQRTIPATPLPGETPPWLMEGWGALTEAERLATIDGWNAYEHAAPARTETAPEISMVAWAIDRFVPGLGQLLLLGLTGTAVRLTRPRGREAAGDAVAALKARRPREAATAGLAFLGLEHVTPDKVEAHARLLDSLVRHGKIHPDLTVDEVLKYARAQSLLPAAPGDGST